MKRIISVLFALTISLYFTACQTPIYVNYNADKSIETNTHKTFVMAPAPDEAPANMPGYSAITAKAIQDKIAEILTSKGYQQVESVDSADMVAAFNVSGELRTQLWGVTGWGWHSSGTINSAAYITGTLVVDFYDTATKTLFWHGWAQADFFETQQDKGEGERAIKLILDKFPSAKN